VTIVVVVFPVISLDMLLAATYLSVIHFDIDTEESELAHLELIATIVRQLTKGLSAKELDSKNFYAYNPSFD
jgi:Mn-containing catalase